MPQQLFNTLGRVYRLRRNNTKHSAWKSYTYEATIRHEQQERVIPISEDDFETLKPTDTLRAYYDESLNDFMLVNYPPDYWQAILPAFFGSLSILAVRSVFAKQHQKHQSLT